MFLLLSVRYCICVIIFVWCNFITRTSHSRRWLSCSSDFQMWFSSLSNHLHFLSAAEFATVYKWQSRSAEDCWLWVCKVAAAPGHGGDFMWLALVHGTWDSSAKKIRCKGEHTFWLLLWSTSYTSFRLSSQWDASWSRAKPNCASLYLLYVCSFDKSGNFK